MGNLKKSCIFASNHKKKKDEKDFDSSFAFDWGVWFDKGAGWI
jgi:hypothetical protein